ncbi:hypothetical protein R1sor_006242 [Riccia sorocarpa]|uniref:Reverse transcriptase/retrotransposon-derived protein RNase H-like domain-containing protein n=1 Tax=Riccia sorocarpa TaxID=122646 RepID=A0ABD3HR38_9MARC
MMNGMNKVLRDFIPEKTMPFLDDVPIKGCREDEKDETLDSRGADGMKGHKFQWEEKHVDAMRRLKALLSSSPVLGRMDYHCGRLVILTVDTSPIAIGWAVGQDDENGNRIAVRFGARVLSSRQREYPQVKRELWGVVTAMKAEEGTT